MRKGRGGEGRREGGGVRMEGGREGGLEGSRGRERGREGGRNEEQRKKEVHGKGVACTISFGRHTLAVYKLLSLV